MQNDQPNPWDPTQQPPQYNPYPAQMPPQSAQIPPVPPQPPQPIAQPTQPYYGAPQPAQPQAPQAPFMAQPAQPPTALPSQPAQQPWLAQPAPKPMYPTQYPQQQQYQPQPQQSYAQPKSFFQKFKLRLPWRPKAIAAVAVVVLLVAGAVFAGTQLIHRPIHHEDVLTAIQAAQNADQDLSDALQTYNDESVGATATASTIAIAAGTINSKLADAKSQVDALKKSAVLGDGKVSTAFQAYDKKFGPYVDYLQQNNSDFTKIGPIVNGAMAKLQSAINNVPSSNSKMPSYLSNLKSQLEAINKQLGSVQVQSDTNKQGLTAFKAYISSWLDDVGQAQSDLAGGSDYYTVVEDLFKIDSAQTKLYNALDNVNTQESANLKRLDPENEFNALTSALTNLSLSITN